MTFGPFRISCVSKQNSHVTAVSLVFVNKKWRRWSGKDIFDLYISYSPSLLYSTCCNIVVKFLSLFSVF